MHLLVKIRTTEFTIILYPEWFDIALVKNLIYYIIFRHRNFVDITDLECRINDLDQFLTGESW